MVRATRHFLKDKVLGLVARSKRLSRINYRSVGIRPQDLPYVPSPEHFRAANRRMAEIDQQVMRRLQKVQASWQTAPVDQVLLEVALVERELDRARRAFGLFFEVFGQRGTSFAPALAAHDVIAADCYTAIREQSPQVFRGPLLKPVCYMEHGFSPATMRRGVLLSRLLGEANPFPVIRLPWDREHPWQAVFLHEVSHNLQADLGIWQENREAVVRRLIGSTGDPAITSIYGRWHKEIFADLAAVLLGGPAAAFGMATFLAHPAPRTLTFRPGGAHPTAYLRIFILVEMLRRLGFGRQGERLGQIWRDLYDPTRFNRLPARLLSSADRVIPQVVDEIAFQTRRNLSQQALVDILAFDRQDEARIVQGAKFLARGQPADLPPRHLVSAASYALGLGGVHPQQLAHQVIQQLNRQQPRPALSLAEAQQQVAA
ncbi:hypothetical protein [Candidatus Cyanaurora vandensis]|uniref:hypothetical protein n=1 Tax=Candidatus Cyanaurora vandensis TaxID=2714958 RepID=UPI00257DF2DA|nr:hypothetical protein [Candidatus Cyanaurora vandensis]